MYNEIIVADAGPIFSLAVINQLHILDFFYQKIVIPTAVWEEITRDDSTAEFPLI